MSKKPKICFHCENGLHCPFLFEETEFECEYKVKREDHIETTMLEECL